MAPDLGLAGSLLEGAKNLARRASNSVAGQDFNRRAFEEAQKGGVDYIDEDLDEDDEDDGEESWSGVLGVQREEETTGRQDFAVQEAPSKLQQLTYKVSEKGLAAAGRAAGLSAEYVGYAMKFVAVETARDIGWLATCKTTTDALLSLKQRFPLLEDLKRALENGIRDGQEQTRRASITHQNHPLITHPREVTIPSNLDNRAILGDSQIQPHVALHMGKRIYDPAIHAGLEEVPADPNNLYSDDEDTLGENRVTFTRHDPLGPIKFEEVPLYDDSDDEEPVAFSPGAMKMLENSQEGDDYFGKTQ